MGVRRGGGGGQNSQKSNNNHAVRYKCVSMVLPYFYILGEKITFPLAIYETTPKKEYFENLKISKKSKKFVNFI